MAHVKQIKDAIRKVFVNSQNPPATSMLVRTDSVPLGYLDMQLLHTTILRDLDAATCTTPGMVIRVGSGCTNFPTKDSNGGVLVVLGHSAANIVQIFTKSNLSVPCMYVRNLYNGTWTEWHKVAMEPVSAT